MMDHMTAPAGKNMLLAAAIRAAIDHAERYGDRETAADLTFILDGCVKNALGADWRRPGFDWASLFKV